MVSFLPWILAAVGAASAGEPIYQGYAVSISKVEERNNITIYDKKWVGGGSSTVYAGEGHSIVIVTIELEATEQASPSFVDDDGKAAIPRSKIALVDKAGKTSYAPSSWTGRRWDEWDRAAEEIKFKKGKTKATMKYLFRVADPFDRKAAALKLDTWELPLSSK